MQNLDENSFCSTDQILERKKRSQFVGFQKSGLSTKNIVCSEVEKTSVDFDFLYFKPSKTSLKSRLELHPKVWGYEKRSHNFFVNFSQKINFRDIPLIFVENRQIKRFC